MGHLYRNSDRFPCVSVHLSVVCYCVSVCMLMDLGVCLSVCVRREEKKKRLVWRRMFPQWSTLLLRKNKVRRNAISSEDLRVSVNDLKDKLRRESIKRWLEWTWKNTLIHIYMCPACQGNQQYTCRDFIPRIRWARTSSIHIETGFRVPRYSSYDSISERHLIELVPEKGQPENMLFIFRNSEEIMRQHLEIFTCW